MVNLAKSFYPGYYCKVDILEILATAKENSISILKWKNQRNIVERFTSLDKTTNDSMSFLTSKYNLNIDLKELRGVVILENDVLSPEEINGLTCSYVVTADARYLFYLLVSSDKFNKTFCFSSILRFIGSRIAKLRNIILWKTILNCKLSNGVVIHHTVILGRNVSVKSNSVIGQSGFGYATKRGNVPIRIPHNGSVVIGNRVEIGACTTIDRGTFGNTIIEDDVKIDNGVHVGHNVYLGARTIIAAHAEISGSVVIGRDCWIAPNVSIRDKVKIGDGAIVGIGSVVVKDVPPNTIVYGVPARQRVN